MNYITRTMFKNVDWWIVAFLIPLLIMSVLTMLSFDQTGVSLAGKQMLWIGISFIAMFTFASLNLDFLKQTKVVTIIYIAGVLMLAGLMFFGTTVNGSTSWYSFGSFSFQPADFLKIVLILILAKYLARRHIEIKAMKHICITILYLIIPFAFIFFQPDFGSAAMLSAIWFGLILVSGISKKHFIIFSILSLILGFILWFGVLENYQKSRITSFLYPLSDIQGAGYNAYQSTIAVGSGQVIGKGFGYGTQSRLSFLPEYETDFIFAAIAEEWGFIGSLIIISLLVAIVTRILYIASTMMGNFELLFAVGVAIYFIAHITVNIGMNIGLLPVTGVTLPFLSYGGSHLIIEFIALGMLMSFGRNTGRVYTDDSTETLLKINNK